MHILVVEDDAPLRRALSRILQAGGIQIITEALDGQDALDCMEEIEPDLILTDFQMPRLDGIALVRALRARGNAIPVIMLSGQGEQQVIVAAIKAGVSNYLPKPINPELLIEKIWQALNLNRLSA